VTLARIVFIVAGIWGVVVLTPLYWLVDITGRQYRSPTEYPHFFYGFLGVAMAWQTAIAARTGALAIEGRAEAFVRVCVGPSIAMVVGGSLVGAAIDNNIGNDLVYRAPSASGRSVTSSLSPFLAGRRGLSFWVRF
jgi:hypothetical protein